MKRDKWLVVVTGFVLCFAVALSAQTANGEKEEKMRPARHHFLGLHGLEIQKDLMHLDLHLEGLKALEHLKGLIQLEELGHLGEMLASQLDECEDLKSLDVLSSLEVFETLKDFDFEFNFDWDDLVLNFSEMDFDFDWECGTPLKNIKQKKDTKIK